MYEAERDPYCYPGTDVLKNKAGLTSASALERFETAMTFARSEEPLPRGRLSASHYRAIHHHLFQNVYTWAGKYRTIRIAKRESLFCYPENIASEMVSLFAWLKRHRYLQHLEARAFAGSAAHFSQSSTPFIRSARATAERSSPSSRYWPTRPDIHSISTSSIRTPCSSSCFEPSSAIL